MNAKLKGKLKESDRRIAMALDDLSCNARGRVIVALLSPLFDKAGYLDSVGLKAMLALVEEFVNNQRRGFIKLPLP